MPSFFESVSGSDQLAALCAVRDEITRDLEACESMRDKAALYLRLTDVLDKIQALRPPEKKGDAVDEIAARRSARRSGSAAGASRAKRPG